MATVIVVMFFTQLIWFSYSNEPEVSKVLMRDDYTSISTATFEMQHSHRLFLASAKNVTTKTDSSLECAFACIHQPWCRSFNFETTCDSLGAHLCEVLSADRYQKPRALQFNSNFSHFNIKSPCHSRPCMNGGSCVALYDKNDFTCTCLMGFKGKHCESYVQHATCKEVLSFNGSKGNRDYTLHIGGNKLSVFCHMTDIPRCGGGGWTLVMKTDGSKDTFSFSSSYWTNKDSYRSDAGKTGFDQQETKLPTYWETSFTLICFGMKIGNEMKFMKLEQNSPSLYSLIADGHFRPTARGSENWKSLISRSRLQTNCNREGFNAVADDNKHAMTRIGIITNGEGDCRSCDSLLGFGTKNFRVPSNTCGSSYLARENFEAMGYIFVQ